MNPTEPAHTNRLVHEKSPYLLQHAHNPVDWYPWGDEALQRARGEDRPIFLSIGYSTCHWCHVMERESFENETIAEFLNRHFVPIKVDREERPDLDNLYMTAVQAMTGHGGWPMSVFLTPDLEPFYSGTYFPPHSTGRMPGFLDLITRLSDAWRNDRRRVLDSSDQVADFLRRQAEQGTGGAAASPLDEAFLDAAYRDLASGYDETHGGFGGAPKFPTPHRITFLLRHHHRTGDERALAMATASLDAMANGGMHDHLAGGFHRYSTDARWLAPHFEKMLYDQASLLLAYTQAWQATGNPDYEAVARGIGEYVITTLTHPGGGFYSAEDADSEGEEGKFYVWSADEIDSVLGPGGGAVFRKNYDVTALGNWEDTNILHTERLDLLRDPDMILARRELLDVRATRIRPHLDDKIVVAWNGYMIEALARAGFAFDEPRHLEAARRAEAFVHGHLYRDGRLLRHYREGAAGVAGYLEDYAYMGRALVALFETTFDPQYLERGHRLAGEMLRLFHREEGGFVFSGADAEPLLAPVIELYDGAIPSGNSMAASFLLRLGHLTADRELRETGWKTVESFGTALQRSPSSFLEMAAALDFALGPNTEVVVAGEPGARETAAMLDVLRSKFAPNMVLAFRPPGGQELLTSLVPYLETQTAIDGKPAAYVCRDYACTLPVHDAGALRERLNE